MTEKPLARHFVYNSECLSNQYIPPTIINPFRNSIISTNHEKGLEFQPIVNPFTPYSFSIL